MSSTSRAPRAADGPLVRDKPIRDSLLRLIGRPGLHAVKRTSVEDLRDLVRSLRPIDSGWPLVRVGPDGDGGYLVPDDLDGITCVFSPGVSTESGFELDLAERGMRVFLADGSVDGPAVPHPRFAFDKRFVGALSSADTMTLDEWAAHRKPSPEADWLLQMDIEGAEFETLLGASPELLRRFRIIVVEFHYLHQLWNKPWFLHVSRVFAKLLATHSVVHVHPNNCCGSFRSRGLVIPRVAELTFHRNDRVRCRAPRTEFPHPLDRDNTRKATLPLDRCWYTD